MPFMFLRADSPLAEAIPPSFLPNALFNALVADEDERFAIRLLRLARKSLRENPDVAAALGEDRAHSR